MPCLGRLGRLATRFQQTSEEDALRSEDDDDEDGEDALTRA